MAGLGTSCVNFPDRIIATPSPIVLRGMKPTSQAILQKNTFDSCLPHGWEYMHEAHWNKYTHTHTRTHNHVWTHFGNEACGSSKMAPQVKPLHLMPISHIVLVKAGGSASHPAPCSCTEGGRKWPDPSVWASNRSEGLPGCFLPFVKWISGLIILSTSKVWEADYDDVKQ